MNALAFIVFTFFPIVTVLNLSHCENAEFPITSILSGITAPSKKIQLSNIPSGISLIVLEIVIFSKLLHANTLLPHFVTVVGISNVIKLQPSKALSPTVLRFFDHVIFSTFFSARKALSSIVVTVSGITISFATFFEPSMLFTFNAYDAIVLTPSGITTFSALPS